MFSADRALFEWINHWPDSLSGFFIFLSEATKNKIVLAILVALSIGLLWNKPTRKPTIIALLSWPIANGLTDLLKNGIPFRRPTHDPIDVVMRIGRLSEFGTASAHAANMAAIAFVFIYFFGRRVSALVLIPLFVGLSRIYVGVHYPTQVLLGWICGCAASLVVIKAWEAIERTRKGPNIVSKDEHATVETD